MGAVAHNFPQYTEAEASADRALHLAALPAAISAVSWLFIAAIPTAGIVQAIALVMYGCGLVGMLAASAAYNLCRPSYRKELLRRVDHAMIFVMIAGTYTPFTLYAFGRDGLLCLPIWLLAAIGIAVTLAFPPPVRTTAARALSHHGVDSTRYGAQLHPSPLKPCAVSAAGGRRRVLRRGIRPCSVSVPVPQCGLAYARLTRRRIALGGDRSAVRAS
jgi:hypothetical protein